MGGGHPERTYKDEKRRKTSLYVRPGECVPGGGGAKRFAERASQLGAGASGAGAGRADEIRRGEKVGRARLPASDWSVVSLS